LIDDARKWIDENVINREMPAKVQISPSETTGSAAVPAEEKKDAEMVDKQEDQDKSVVPEAKPYGPLDVDGVQVFQPTAPPEFCGPAFPGKYVFPR
jgi:hypothetical protein